MSYVRTATSLALFGAALLATPAMSQNSTNLGAIEAIQAQRDTFINHFRATGEFRSDLATAVVDAAREAANTSTGEPRARAVYELGTALRLMSRFDEALTSFHETASTAEALGLTDLSFDAWIGIARAHSYGDANHGAAAQAIRHAIDQAGDSPTRSQAYEIADYSAQLESGRGELHSALLKALDAYRLASEPVEQFYGALGVGDVLQKFAERCDYHKLIDARSRDDEDGWGACRRAVSSAESYYRIAQAKAQELGWDFLANEAAGFASRLQPRLMIINSKAQFDSFGQSGIFVAQNVDDVLVNDDFSAGASDLGEYQALGALIDEVADDEQSKDPRTQFLLGLRQDLNGNPKAALAHFERAAALLQSERSTLFDPRGRGTVVENRPELVRDLALRLLALGRPDQSFATFESMRASGLNRLRGAIARQNLNAEDRARFARLVDLDSRASALRVRLVETTIAGVDHSRSLTLLNEVRDLEASHRELVRSTDYAQLLEGLASYNFQAAALPELERLAKESGTAIVFYWVTATNVLVWVIGPQGSEVKTVFLPEPVVSEKVAAIVASVTAPDAAYATTEARELHTYLIKPFARHLSGAKLVIVPQGVLTSLPFEALIDAQTNSYLAEDLVVSYAPSATMAAQLLATPHHGANRVATLYDELIDGTTAEIAGIAAIESLELVKCSSQKSTPAQAIEFLSTAPLAHVLLHGIFDVDDPLQSYLQLENPLLSAAERRITAAELLAVDWRATSLAVFSACEGARVTARVSNEIHGLSWAPLVGGAEAVLVSRWRVRSASNARWMRIFYGALSEGRGGANASALAMREMMTGDNAHPHYWAGPQLYGR